MKVKLRVIKAGASLYEGIYHISDAESFGKACADVWGRLTQQQMETETSIGALMDHLERDALDQLNGAHIILEPA